MRVRNGSEHLEKQADACCGVEPVVVAVGVDWHAIDVVHDEVRRALVRDAAVDQSRDVCVFEIREDLALRQEPQACRLGADAEGQDFQRRRLLELLVGARGEVFLGEDSSGTPIFALDMPAGWEMEASPIAGLGAFTEMRGAAAMLSPLEANLASTARSLFEWHRAHGFCSRCGQESHVSEAGWKRDCPACRAEHFPRTDPVAIMLAHRGDKCLMARQASWPQGFISALAGFVEPGETVEQAAVRELEEEAGIKADPANAEYLFCQPWPFPSSLMVGLLIPADSEEISVEQDELEAAWWITREEARQMLAGAHPRFYCPPPLAVAHHILKAWAERED
jgi:NAD+ diphosphatase